MWNKKIRVLEPFKSRGLTDNLNYQFVGLTIVPALDVDRGNPLGDYFLPVPCEQKWPLPSELTCEFVRLTTYQLRVWTKNIHASLYYLQILHTANLESGMKSCISFTAPVADLRARISALELFCQFVRLTNILAFSREGGILAYRE
jgi:hypothetical protein